MSINNIQGVVLEGNDIVTKFVKHFEKFFGQSQHVEPIGELEGIFTNTLYNDEALEMVKDVTDKEIKNAMFDISDCKAPRPGGYSACYFKKAWEVVGKDVCQLVKDFFENGKLLKEINSTLIALIPKVAQPNNITEFRPIGCCNVIYKCISKILTSRIKKGLNKLVNLNQSAFIQGRSIQDNILLTQELLKGYNRKGGSKRCSLKIDIAKAYDTISWEFLINILRMFGFHDKIIEWICTCITSTSFSISINEESHGNFKGERIKTDEESVIVIKEDLDLWLIPTRYLEVPLISKRLGKTECKQLVDKVKSKVGDWKNKFLSYAGRVQLIAYVLSSMHIYWALVFLFPKTTVKDIERVLKGFLWNQGDVVRGKAKIAWKTICKPKMKGGLGFKDLGSRNEVLLTKHIWNIAANKETLWVQWVHMVKLKGRSVWEIDVEANDSWIWKNLLSLRSKARRHIEHKIGNGENTSIWVDKWCESGPLCQIITNRDIYDGRFNLKASLADMITNGQWIWNDERQEKFPNICSIKVLVLTNEKDTVVWKSKSGSVKKFSVKQVWDDYSEENPNVNWGTLERNKRQFTNERRNVDDLSKIILDTVRLKLSSIKVIKTVFVESVETKWGNSDGWYLDGSMNFKGNWMNNQMRDRLGNVVIELWSGAKWVFALG
ncbi:probable L-cysteine desulfhydrase, chloroplastic [Tanacetum coccineum]